jgi:gentisate 1,2-dioxygenase
MSEQDTPAPALATGSAAHSPLTGDAVYYEYTQAADPIGRGIVPPVPVDRFGPELYTGRPSGVAPLDLSAHLGVAGPATSPALCANFVRIAAGDEVATAVNASSQMFYVMTGRGHSRFAGQVLGWSRGDFLALPAGHDAVHSSEEDAVLYWVHDGPLMAYLGVTGLRPRFEPTHYPHEDTLRCLDQVAADPAAADRNRISILLANRAMDRTLTLTHVLWAMFGLLPAGGLQPPHRHQSVALDLVVDCRPGCYTLLGDLDEDGKRLVNVKRVDWEPGTAFVTPPGKWHSHHNESGADAHIIPIQDAGLQTYLRSLDIRFMSSGRAAEALGEDFHTPLRDAPAQ